MAGGGREVGGRACRMWPASEVVRSWQWWWDGRSGKEIMFQLVRGRGEVGAALRLVANLEALRPIKWDWWPWEDGRWCGRCVVMIVGVQLSTVNSRNVRPVPCRCSGGTGCWPVLD